MSDRRFHEIDVLKGLACYLMLCGHAFRGLPTGLPPLTMLDRAIVYAMDFSGPIFFLASGMNVCTFWDRNRDKPGFRATWFYLASALVLYLLGFTYSLAIGSIRFGVPDIFQGVAVCTALVFLLTRLNVKAYVYLLVALIAYAGYWLGFRAHIVPTRELVMAMGWPLKQFVAHFSPLPWVVFFLFGAALYRIRTRRGEIAMSLLFLAMIGLSFTLRPAFFIDPFELIFRGVPTYVLQTTAVGGLAFLALRRAWPDKPRFVIWRILDFAGRESFMFLILHYFLITLLVIVIMGARGQGHDAVWMTMYPRAAIIVVGTALLLPVAARLRDRVAVIPGFIPATLVALTVLGFASAAMNAPQLYVTARLAGFGAAFAFAFVFPSLRVKLRTHFSDPPPTPDAGAHG